MDRSPATPPRTFAAYYIVWTLVRNINIVFTPYGWEWRIREGELSAQLLKPVHPIHYDLGWFAGTKVVVVLLWLPIAVVLSLLFKPELSPTAQQIGVFAVAIWGAYVLRSLYMWALGMVTFWTTRVSALFELVWVTEMLLSGRIVPLALLPDWAERLSWFLPFRWTFGFPITALVGPIDGAELLGGLGMQLLWIVVLRPRRPRLLAGERAALRGGRRMRAPAPLAGGRLALLFLRVSVMNDLQYRANFVIQLFQSLLALGHRARRAGADLRPDRRARRVVADGADRGHGHLHDHGRRSSAARSSRTCSG